MLGRYLSPLIETAILRRFCKRTNLASREGWRMTVGAARGLVGDVCVGDDFPDVAVFAVEVEAASLMLVVDLAVRP